MTAQEAIKSLNEAIEYFNAKYEPGEIWNIDDATIAGNLEYVRLFLLDVAKQHLAMKEWVKADGTMSFPDADDKMFELAKGVAT